MGWQASGMGVHNSNVNESVNCFVWNFNVHIMFSKWPIHLPPPPKKKNSSRHSKTFNVKTQKEKFFRKSKTLK